MFHSPLKVGTVAAFCVAYIAAESAAWIALVPQLMSVMSFALTSAVGMVLTGVALWTAAGARATRSIAHVLYDVEHPETRVGAAAPGDLR